MGKVASVIPTAVAVAVPTVSAVVDEYEVGASEVEIIAMRIACVDGKVPITTVPVERTIKVAGCTISAVLPVEQYVAQVQITTVPIHAIQVVIVVYPHEIVEVYLVGGLVLSVVQIQFVSHLVRKEKSLFACLGVAHCVCRNCHCEQCGQDYHHLFHNRKFLKWLLYLMQSNEEYSACRKDFPYIGRGFSLHLQKREEAGRGNEKQVGMK